MSIVNYFKKASPPRIDPEDKGDSDIEVLAQGAILSIEVTVRVKSERGTKKIRARSRAQCYKYPPPSIPNPPLDPERGVPDRGARVAHGKILHVTTPTSDASSLSLNAKPERVHLTFVEALGRILRKVHA